MKTAAKINKKNIEKLTEPNLQLPATSLLSAEEILASNKDLVLNVNSKTSAQSILAHFLRHFRGEVETAEQLLSEPVVEGVSLVERFERELEGCRNRVRLGRFEAVINHIDLLLKQNSAFFLSHQDLILEFKIEKTRSLYFSGKVFEAISLSSEILSSSALRALSRMTVYQLRADIYISINDLSSAKIELEKALVLVDLFPEAMSSLSVVAFLSVLNAKQGLHAEALQGLRQMQQLLMKYEQQNLLVDRLLTYTRTGAVVYRLLGEKILFEQAWLQSYVLSKLLQDHVSLDKCEAEWIDYDLSVDIKSTADQTLFFWFQEMGLFVYLPELQVISLKDKPILIQILSILVAGPSSAEQIFETVWQMAFDKEVHSGLMRVHLSNLRKLLPQNMIECQNSQWRLVGRQSI